MITFVKQGPKAGLLGVLLVLITASRLFGGEDQQATEIDGLNHDLATRLGIQTFEAVPDGWFLFSRGVITETSLRYELLHPESQSPHRDHVSVCVSVGGDVGCRARVDPNVWPVRLTMNADAEFVAWCYGGESACEADALPRLLETWTSRTR